MNLLDNPFLQTKKIRKRIHQGHLYTYKMTKTLIWTGTHTGEGEKGFCGVSSPRVLKVQLEVWFFTVQMTHFSRDGLRLYSALRINLSHVSVLSTGSTAFVPAPSVYACFVVSTRSFAVIRIRYGRYGRYLLKIETKRPRVFYKGSFEARQSFSKGPKGVLN